MSIDAAFRTARQALRSQPVTATPDDRAMLGERYRDAVERRDEAITASQMAERAYRAYRRTMLARLKRGVAIQHDALSPSSEREQTMMAVRQRRSR